MRRAGLDYWEKVTLRVWDSFGEFVTALAPEANEIALFSKKGSRSFWEMLPCARMFLVFGSETKGLPDSILSDFPTSIYHIPISREIRSLNLSTAVGIALYDSLRGSAFHAHGDPEGPALALAPGGDIP